MDGQGYSIRKSGGVTAPPEGSSVPGEKALELINRYTRRHFSAGELYTFPVVLCDNEIDRDGERFTAGALEKLAGLFPGKTGIFNHSGKAESQTARLYSCRVERDPARRTLAGNPMRALWAKPTCRGRKRTPTLSPNWTAESRKRSASGAPSRR